MNMIKKVSLALSIGVVSLGVMAGCSSNQPQNQSQSQTQSQPTPKQTKFIEVHVGTGTATELINVDHIVLVNKDNFKRAVIVTDNSNTFISTNDSYDEVMAEIEKGGN